MARERAHILIALDRAGEGWSEVLGIVNDADDAAAARQSVAAALGLDEMQASAVLDMQFRRVTRADRERLRAELTELRSEIQRLTDAQ
jgi:DNA gyrase subunit A